MMYMYFVFFKTAIDYLEGALASVAPEVEKIFIINNSDRILKLQDQRGIVITPAYPMTFSQTFNYARSLALQNDVDVLFTQHDDGQFVTPESCKEFMDFVAGLDKKWGQILTSHDVVTAYSANMLKEVGEMDIVLPQYYADFDYFRRMELAGYEVHQSDFKDKVLHMNGGSNTIKNDPHLKLTQDYTFPLYEQYYALKWGGKLGKEQYKFPFNKEVVK